MKSWQEIHDYGIKNFSGYTQDCWIDTARDLYLAGKVEEIEAMLLER